MRLVALSLPVFSLVLVGTATRAQQIEPRAYSNAPTHVNFLLASYGYAEGSVVVDPSLPLEDGTLEVHVTALAYVRTLNLWGVHAKASAVVPHAWLSGTGQISDQPVTRDVDGFGDLAVRLTVNVFGSPALSLAEFARYRQRTIVGVSVNVSAPTGQYESGKLVNIGTHRWQAKPEVGVSHVAGRLTLELATGVSFFGDNDDFAGGKSREQEPVYSVQGGVVCSLSRGMWAALNGTYFAGGRTTVDGLENNDRQENTRGALTFTMPVSRNHSIKLFAGTGISTRTGGDYDIVSLTWQYRWGGGM